MDQASNKNENELLQQLSESRDPQARREAIEQLSALPVDEGIARAILSTRLFDADTRVRDAAGQALQKPAIRELIANNQDLQREVIQSGARVATAEPHSKAMLQEEFERRRADQVRVSYGAFAILVILFVIMWFKIEPLAPLAFLLSIALLAGFALFSWRNWRCPECRANLWSKPPGVDPWRTRGKVQCPHCGVQLR